MTSRSAQSDQDRKIVAAIPKYLSSVTSISLDGASFTPATLVQLFQQRINLADAATKAKAALADAVKANDANLAQGKGVEAAFKSYVLSLFRTQAGPLEDFGYTPPKSTSNKSAEVNALAVVKLRATRKARGTVGKKAKLKISGNANPQIVSGAEPPTASAGSLLPVVATVATVGTKGPTGNAS